MRDSIAAVLMIASFVIFVAALIALFRPLPRLGLGTRKRALTGFGVAVVLFVVTAAVMPPPKESTSTPARSATPSKGGTIADADSQVASVEAYPATSHSSVKVDLAGADSDADVLNRASLVLKSIGEAVQAGAPDLPAGTKTISIWFTMPLLDNDDRQRVLEMRFTTEALSKIEYGELAFQQMLDQYEEVEFGGPVGRRSAEAFCAEEDARYSPRFCSAASTPL